MPDLPKGYRRSPSPRELAEADRAASSAADAAAADGRVQLCRRAAAALDAARVAADAVVEVRRAFGRRSLPGWYLGTHVFPAPDGGRSGGVWRQLVLLGDGRVTQAGGGLGQTPEVRTPSAAEPLVLHVERIDVDRRGTAPAEWVGPLVTATLSRHGVPAPN